MKRQQIKAVCALLAVSMLSSVAAPAIVLAEHSEITETARSTNLGEAVYQALLAQGYKQSGAKSLYTDSKRIQFESFGGLNGEDAKLTIRCGANDEKVLEILKLMTGDQSELSYMELAIKIGNGSNPTLSDGTRTIRVQYDGKLDFTLTVLFFNYGHEATQAQMTKYIEPVLKPEPVVVPTATPVPTKRPEPTKTPEGTKSPEVVAPTETPKATKSPEVVVPTETPEATKSPEVVVPTETPEATKSPEVEVPTETPEVSKSPEVEVPIETPEVTKKPEATKKPAVQVKLGKVSNVKVTAAKAKEMTVSWSALQGAETYQVYVREAGKGSYQKATEVSSAVNKVTLTRAGTKAFKSGTTYEILVRGVRTSGTKFVYGGYSKKVKASTALTKPVVSLKAANRKLTSRLKEVKGAEQYEIYLSEKKNGGYKKYAVVSSKKSQYTTKRLNKNKKYYVKVRAVKKVEGKKLYSAYSKTVLVRL